jgi:hypothetical protein
MCCFRHATGTTGQDVRARRDHKYASRCSQCGAVLTDTTRVAAHVVAYPCPCVGCVGILTLRTTCKACNHPHSKRNRGWFVGVSIGILRSRQKRLRWLCCVPPCGGRADVSAD